ncbi:hypothetical protein PM082_002019 [Marasmius tenuissimus]|nr:hypothetical protein PM082_002019 [Marasmius tenuissimus]
MRETPDGLCVSSSPLIAVDERGALTWNVVAIDHEISSAESSACEESACDGLAIFLTGVVTRVFSSALWAPPYARAGGTGLQSWWRSSQLLALDVYGQFRPPRGRKDLDPAVLISPLLWRAPGSTLHEALRSRILVPKDPKNLDFGLS